ncbi:hypothetical protein DL546_002459 [Coniochaeta pulveracea]|uniref:Prokaryotic-type class I peptide chain release factors domain-containing protein n=1 Tax=Coniochaeta pulveracea TaxID=177199 RepID=A0A420Y997_9PEZI|nr:hypothetical protein DL546_002459 [Coniochaeta pulveracea]
MMFRYALRLRLCRHLARPPSSFVPHLAYTPSSPVQSATSVRLIRYQAYDDAFDQDELAEARQWRQSFQPSSLPKGQTTFARSSGPGGQHVNKTETKAITTWPISQLTPLLPKIMHSHLRASKYYTTQKDCLSFQAQDSRSRTANSEENVKKLWEEISRIYEEAVPSETSPEKRQKYAQLRKSATEARLKDKKMMGSKKASRKGRPE